MATRVRTPPETEVLLRRYNKQGITNWNEILDRLKREKPPILIKRSTLGEYLKECRIGTSRRQTIGDDEMKKIVECELKTRPGRKRGVRKVWEALKSEGYHIKRDFVEKVMKEIDPEGFLKRRPKWKCLLDLARAPSYPFQFSHHSSIDSVRLPSGSVVLVDPHDHTQSSGSNGIDSAISSSQLTQVISDSDSQWTFSGQRPSPSTRTQGHTSDVTADGNFSHAIYSSVSIPALTLGIGTESVPEERAALDGLLSALPPDGESLSGMGVEIFASERSNMIDSLKKSHNSDNTLLPVSVLTVDQTHIGINIASVSKANFFPACSDDGVERCERGGCTRDNLSIDVEDSEATEVSKQSLYEPFIPQEKVLSDTMPSPRTEISRRSVWEALKEVEETEARTQIQRLQLQNTIKELLVELDTWCAVPVVSMGLERVGASVSTPSDVRGTLIGKKHAIPYVPDYDVSEETVTNYTLFLALTLQRTLLLHKSRDTIIEVSQQLRELRGRLQDIGMSPSCRREVSIRHQKVAEIALQEIGSDEWVLHDMWNCSAEQVHDSDWFSDQVLEAAAKAADTARRLGSMTNGPIDAKFYHAISLHYDALELWRNNKCVEATDILKQSWNAYLRVLPANSSLGYRKEKMRLICSCFNSIYWIRAHEVEVILLNELSEHAHAMISDPSLAAICSTMKMGNYNVPSEQTLSLETHVIETLRGFQDVRPSRVQGDLAQALKGYGYTLRHRGRIADAEAAHEEAVGIYWKLAKLGDAQAARSLVDLLDDRMYDQLDRGNLENALHMANRFMDVNIRYGASQFPWLVSILQSFESHFLSGRYSDLRILEEMYGLVKSLRVIVDSHPRLLGMLVRATYTISICQLRMGNREAALDVFRDLNCLIGAIIARHGPKGSLHDLEDLIMYLTVHLPQVQELIILKEMHGLVLKLIPLVERSFSLLLPMLGLMYALKSQQRTLGAEEAALEVSRDVNLLMHAVVTRHGFEGSFAHLEKAVWSQDLDVVQELRGMIVSFVPLVDRNPSLLLSMVKIMFAISTRQRTLGAISAALEVSNDINLLVGAAVSRQESSLSSPHLDVILSYVHDILLRTWKVDSQTLEEMWGLITILYPVVSSHPLLLSIMCEVSHTGRRIGAFRFSLFASAEALKIARKRREMGMTEYCASVFACHAQCLIDCDSYDEAAALLQEAQVASVERPHNHHPTDVLWGIPYASLKDFGLVHAHSQRAVGFRSCIDETFGIPENYVHTSEIAMPWWLRHRDPSEIHGEDERAWLLLILAVMRFGTPQANVLEPTKKSLAFISRYLQLHRGSMNAPALASILGHQYLLLSILDKSDGRTKVLHKTIATYREVLDGNEPYMSHLPLLIFLELLLVLSHHHPPLHFKIPALREWKTTVYNGSCLFFDEFVSYLVELPHLLHHFLEK